MSRWVCGDGLGELKHTINSIEFIIWPVMATSLVLVKE